MSQLESHLAAELQAQLNVDLNRFLAPIDREQPSGPSLRHNGVYSAIMEARSADDSSLPMGDWEHDLKVSDWDEVSRLAVDALLNKSKDMQICIWLLEANIHRFGFAGIAPVVYLLEQLLRTFWQDIHPQISDGDIEYRTNLIAWCNDKLQPHIRQLPITMQRDGSGYNWADWELAAQLEQLPPEKLKHVDKNAVRQSAISQAITATPLDFYQYLFNDLELAHSALIRLGEFMDEQCGHDAPGLNNLLNLLGDIYETLHSHVRHRLGNSAPQTHNEADEDAQQAGLSFESIPQGNETMYQNRQQAYQQLMQAAEYLAQDDPHSPVPYLVFKAVEWGQLNTAELYQQLFVQQQGQLNIFELLGLEINK